MKKPNKYRIEAAKYLPCPLDHCERTGVHQIRCPGFNQAALAARLRADGERIAKLEAVRAAAYRCVHLFENLGWNTLSAQHGHDLDLLDKALHRAGGIER